MKTIALVIFLLSNFIRLFAQVDQEPMITDRPGEGTDAPFVVGPGILQIETGIFWQDDAIPSQQLARYPTTLVRVGLVERIELRASLDVFEEGRRTATLISPLVLGTKIHLTENDGWIPQSALMVNFILPDFGSESVQNEYVLPQIKLLMGHTLNEWLGLTTNIGIEWGGDVFTTPEHSYAASFDIGVNDYISAFAEFYGYWSSIDDSHLFNAGGTLLLLPDLQFDLSAGIGLSDNAPDYYVGGGISLRI